MDEGEGVLESDWVEVVEAEDSLVTEAVVDSDRLDDQETVEEVEPEAWSLNE